MCGILAFIEPTVSMGHGFALEDNNGAIKLADNPMRPARSKQVATSYHHTVTMYCVENEVKLRHVSSDQQHTELPTNHLSEVHFRTMENTRWGLGSA